MVAGRGLQREQRGGELHEASQLEMRARLGEGRGWRGEGRVKARVGGEW